MFKTIDAVITWLLKGSFKQQVDGEICDRIFPHLRGEGDRGYSFTTDEQMDALTAQFDARTLLATIEEHAAGMPKAYGKAFRFIVHRDINDRLRAYALLARRRVQPKFDPSCFATRHEPQT